MSADSPMEVDAGNPNSESASKPVVEGAIDREVATEPVQSFPPVPDEPTATKALILLVCHSSLRKQASAVLSTVRVSLELDPILGGMATAFGPEIASTGLLNTGTRGLPRRVRENFLSELPLWAVASTDQLALGVVVVASTLSQTKEHLDVLTGSAEFATLPLLFRGLSLDGQASSTDARVMTVPPGSPTRTDEAILRLIQDLVSEAESDRRWRLSVAHVEAMTGVAPTLTDRVVVSVDPAVASKVGTLEGAVDNRYLVSSEGGAVEIVYLAIASGPESRTKHIRAREVELAIALDKVLHERFPTPLCQTWVIQMGLTSQPVVVRGGTLTASAFHNPGSTHIDLTDEIERIGRTLREVSDSYARRGMTTTTPPVVVVILPSLTTPGFRFLRAVEQLSSTSHTAWLLVADDNDGLGKLPTDRVFRDKPDVVNEVAYFAFARPTPPDDTKPDHTNPDNPPASPHAGSD